MSTQNAIAFTSGSQIKPMNAADRICYIIQPFIQEIFDFFVESNDLNQAIIQAAKKHEKVADKLFSIEPSNEQDSFTLKDDFLFIDENPLLVLS